MPLLFDSRLDGHVATHAAHRLEDVMPVIAQADQAAREGRWAAVVVAYEAAPAFEPALAGRMAPPIPGLPLAWVGVYERAVADEAGVSRDRGASLIRLAEANPIGLAPRTTEASFVEQALRVQEYIRAGDTYQVNLTFPIDVDSAPDFEQLRQAQRARYCAHIDLGSHEILSFSPELFFERSGTRLTTRPMKGTAPRGRWRAEDEAIAAQLAQSPKERAENVMIVDMLRNDVGRVARAGSVHVPQLFTTERYPTLWQMTSTVEGELVPDVTLVDLFRALFPCGSVTGAPKIRTMQIIAALEQQPRGIYTGAIGLVRPGGDCTFSVAIRTVVVDQATGAASLGVGAGVTADSDPGAEFDECLLKAAFLRQRLSDTMDFQLLETMRLEGGTIARLDRHLRRAADAAEYFGFVWDEMRVRAALDAAIAAHPAGLWRCRMLARRNGAASVECSPYVDDTRTWRVAFAAAPVDDRSPFLFNKTTERRAYELARRARPDADDVLMWNARGEVTESTIANLVVEIDGHRLTPPVSSGLLGGVFRSELLQRGLVRERLLTRADVAGASRIWLVNSLRGWIEAALIQ